MILKFMWKGKGIRKVKISSKKNTVGVLTTPEFRTYYEVTVIKTG